MVMKFVKSKFGKKLAEVLLIAGGLNWGLTLFNVNLVDMLPSFVPQVVYALVGLAAVMAIVDMVRK